jgi:hypothetical protein
MAWKSSAIFGPRRVAAFLPSTKTGAAGLSPVPGKRDADVGMLGFTGAVDDAAHDGDLKAFDTWILVTPERHVASQIILNGARQLLEHGGGGAAAAGAGGDHRHKLPEAHHLQQFLGDNDFAGAVASGLRCQRDSDGVADARLQDDAHGRGRGDDALRAHAGLGQAQMQGMVGAARQFGVDRDQILHLADLGGENDPIALQAGFLGQCRRMQRRLDDGFAGDIAGAQRRSVGGVLVHQPGQQDLVERSPVDADADRLVVADGHFYDFDELPVLLVLEADIARIDAVLRQRFGTGGMIGEQRVADVMKIADQRHIETEPFEALADLRNRGSALIAVDGDPDDLGAGAMQGCDLGNGGVDIGGIGVGHGLHHNGCAATDDDAADIDCDTAATGLRDNKGGTGHVCLGCNLGRPGPPVCSLPKTREFEMEVV